MPARSPQHLWNGPAAAETIVVLAHGAGAGMETPFMEYFAAGLGERGFRVARFEFPYMAARRASDRRRPPDREPLLRETWHSVIASLPSDRLVIGGKSMGGRMASLVADEAGVLGLVCLGYPFHPVGKPKQLRTEHLQRIRTPTLIVQGERDPFGNRDDVHGYELSPQVRVHWLGDGDHSFKPRKSSGRTEDANWREAVDTITAFASEL